MKIKVLYEDDIKNGHKVYITIEVPDDDYTVILDMDYEQRLAEAEPDKRDQVKRCNTLQEVFDHMNKADTTAGESTIVIWETQKLRHMKTTGPGMMVQLGTNLS